MLHITQLRLRPGEEKDLESAASKYLKIPKQDVLAVKLLRLSVDARKRYDVRYVLSLAVSVKNEKAVLAKNKNRSVSVYQKAEQRLNAQKSVIPALRPVVVARALRVFLPRCSLPWRVQSPYCLSAEKTLTAEAPMLS